MAELFGQHQHAAIRIQDLGPPVGLFHRLAIADRSMVGQDHHVGTMNERDDRVGKVLSTGCFVLGDRNITQETLRLPAECTVESARERSRRRLHAVDGSERRS